MTKEAIEIFINKFPLEQLGFREITPFEDGSCGFSAKINPIDNKTGYSTLLSVYLYEDKNNVSEKNTLIVHATYGEVTDDGIKIRENPRFNDPVDVDSRDYFFYDKEKEVFYRNNEEVDPKQIIEEIYAKHLKSTRLFAGFWLRSKLFFWRLLARTTFELISKTFALILYLISGDKFSYEPVFETETLNGNIIKSRIDWGKSVEGKGDLKESPKVDFFNYKVKHWPILFYAILHGTVFAICFFKNFKPAIITKIFDNNFLTVLYVILSLWIIETVLSRALIFLIRFFSRSAFFAQTKGIEL